MTLQEFDLLLDKMQLAFDYSANLGQYVESAKILYQMNDQLPGDLQISLDTLQENITRQILLEHHSQIKSSISEYRELLMTS